MKLFKGLLAASIAAIAFAAPSAAQSPPFNAYSIATLGGNCSTANALPYQTTAAKTACTPGGLNGQVMTLVGGVPQWTTVSGTGTVTSVALSLPSIFTVTGSPITASGTLTGTLASQSQNLFFASPNGSAGAPSFRSMVAADVPALDTSKLTSGTLPVARGGTGVTAATGTGSVVLNTDPVFAGDVRISGVVGSNRRLNFQTSGVDRWMIRPSAEAESGGNAGSNFEITRRDDAGAGLGTPFFIERATGEVGINTVTPGYQLDVNGTFNVSGTATATTRPRGDNSVGIATTGFVANNKAAVDPRDFGATCNGVANDSAAWAAAKANAVSTNRAMVVTCNIGIANPSGVNIGGVTIFSEGGMITILSGGAVGIDANAEIIAADIQQIFGGLNDQFYSDAYKGRFSACWFGACDNSADVADNIRNMLANSGTSGKTFIFPPGNYNLCSAVPVGTGAGQVGYPATNQSSVIFKQKTNFKVYANGATFTTCAAIAQNIAFLMDRNTDFTWDYGNFVGSRSGLSTATVNAPFQLMNNQRFTLTNTRAVSGYTDAGAFFEGDGNVDFLIANNRGTVGQGVDMAFSKNGTYRDNAFVGASTDGNNIGLKGFSHIYDGPLVSPTNYIYSGVTQSENIAVINNRFENYVSGIVIQEGKHWKIHENYLLDIKGLGASAAAGVLVNYVPSGSFSNVGHTPINLSIQENQVDGLGTNVAGCGVNIGANAIANGDVFNRTIINGNMFSGTAGSTAICADTNSAAKIANFFVGINEYSNVGALMNANASSLAKPATLPR